jgi:hypothetical protein
VLMICGYRDARRALLSDKNVPPAARQLLAGLRSRLRDPPPLHPRRIH